MNTIINQPAQNETSRDVDYCLQKFEGSANEVVNLYKCNQQKFSASDSWNIQKSKKHLSIKPGLLERI